ncbi:nucleotide exchange factor GrpE [Candidatus Synchoanobacter obligatus]|uniref:Protein GrpE n=1 Tax=Candidatus Synchoanobacter obligatus TaxID=2919597 RepID=A0ABT1L4G2_9GAMM|nr:nucleotide exchange factor GrpE [Candidatus Synchoanobacter obligatus]MCP8352052.1 nucleotide exchange factor GrpE [Candidatus Synchoanobacter obligatus]
MSEKEHIDTKNTVSAEDLKPASAPTEALEDKITELEEEILQLKDKNTRLIAEQHNLGARLKRDFDTKKQYAIANFAKEVLDVGDILKTGLANCSDKDSEHFKGMEMTLDKFYHILKQHGITAIDSLHKAFDHSQHEALTSQETDEHEPGIITQVVQEGYQFHERVLRPAKVIVSKKVSQDS